MAGFDIYKMDQQWRDEQAADAKRQEEEAAAARKAEEDAAAKKAEAAAAVCRGDFPGRGAGRQRPGRPVPGGDHPGAAAR